jgi:hypothetical protein
MKKIVLAVAFAMSAGMSGAVLSATVFGETASTDEVTGGTAGDCPLLQDTVTLGVSANVVGGWACNETTNLIQVAACHKGGSRAQGVACNSDGDPSTPLVVDLPAGCTDVTGNSTIPSFKAFSASSGGGVMSEVVLDQRCTEAQLGGIDWVN